MDKTHIRGGFGAVRPYLHGKVGTCEFLSQVFGAEILEKHEFGPDKFHAELRMYDSAVVVEEGELPKGVKHWANAVYVYVPDVDDVYRRALALGASAFAEPGDKPYGERQACFVDASGNTWWIGSLLR